MKVNGKCFCGGITFEAEVDPHKVIICHCRDCQALSGSAFEVVVMAAREQFRLVSGRPKYYAKSGDGGATRKLAFCADCGSRLYGEDEGEGEDKGEGLLALRVGSLEQRKLLRPALQIWCRSALPWATYDAIPGLEEQSP